MEAFLDLEQIKVMALARLHETALRHAPEQEAALDVVDFNGQRNGAFAAVAAVDVVIDVAAHHVGQAALPRQRNGALGVVGTGGGFVFQLLEGALRKPDAPDLTGNLIRERRGLVHLLHHAQGDEKGAGTRRRALQRLDVDGGRLPPDELVDIGFQGHAQIASELQISTGFVPAGTTGQGGAAGGNGQNKRKCAVGDVH